MKSEDLELELKLNGLDVFTPKDVGRITGKRMNYVYLMLSKSKRFLRMQNGLYYVKGTDPLRIASAVLHPSYISLISAFSYYKLIDQVPNSIKVITSKRHRDIKSIEGMRIEFRSIKRDMLYGYSRKHDVSVADVEKAIVDSLYLLEDMQYIDEAKENAMETGILDPEKLLLYAEKSGVKSVYSKAKRLVQK
jgi:predicted transcriptional regulator of viral defense system